MIRVVADTNIFISALVYGGLPGSLLERAFNGDFLLITSNALLLELFSKLQSKFAVTPSEIDELQVILRDLCDVHSVLPTLNLVPKDPDDNRVLECALAGKAGYIVTGDRHLLELGSFAGAPILKPRDFLDQLDPQA